MSALHEELVLVNSQMAQQGIVQGGRLLFLTHALAYEITFGPAKFGVWRYNRFVPQADWVLVLADGTLHDVVSTLQTDGPYLTADQVPAYWGVVPANRRQVLL